MPLADGDRVVFLRSLRDWYILHLRGIQEPSKRGEGLSLLLTAPLDDIPVTKQSIAHTQCQLKRYRSAELDWTLAAADALITDICVLRDWDDCCVNDQFDLEYVVDTATSSVAKTCTACGYTLDTHGNVRARPEQHRIALRRELVAAGVIEDAS